jgi:hypothetical protein
MTPEMAKNILNGNTGNRNIRTRWVEDLADIIRNNQWQLTHQSIAISKTGRLLDGQHRLSAIVLANTAVPVLITENCDEKSFAFIDKGVKRNLSDNLAINKKVAEIYAFMLHCYGYRSDRPAAAIALKNSDIGFISEYLISTCSTARRSATTAPAKAAAVVCAYITKDIERVATDYRNFVLVDYDKMSPSLKLLERQIATGTANSGKPRDMYVRACKAFFMMGEEAGILKVSDNEEKYYFDMMRHIVESIIKK